MSEERESYGKEPKYMFGQWVSFNHNGNDLTGVVTNWFNGFYTIQVGFEEFSVMEDAIKGLSKDRWGISYIADKPDADEPSNVYRFRGIVSQMAETYKAKNSDYGDSFGKSIEKYGVIAGLTRISDKFNRLENLILTKEQKVSDENIGDTLLDLANYAVMLYMAMNCDISDVEFENEYPNENYGQGKFEA